jgi:hypothetical protein
LIGSEKHKIQELIKTYNVTVFTSISYVIQLFWLQEGR